MNITEYDWSAKKIRIKKPNSIKFNILHLKWTHQATTHHPQHSFHLFYYLVLTTYCAYKIISLLHSHLIIITIHSHLFYHQLRIN